MNIEAEVRSFISKEKYMELLEYFNKEGTLLKEDYQETFYFDCEKDVRIQRNNFYAKIWMKEGKIHDDSREEIEIKFERDQFETLEKLFLGLGYSVSIKWFRKRHQFDWKDVTVCLDYTKGYGYIIELEKMCTSEEQESIVNQLKKLLGSLSIPISSKDEFEEKFLYYQENWKSLVEN